MYQNYSISEKSTFFQKLRSIDYLLLFSVLIVGLISIFAMYSTDGGEILYHTKNHIYRFSVFFVMMITISFLNIIHILLVLLFIPYF